MLCGLTQTTSYPQAEDDKGLPSRGIYGGPAEYQALFQGRRYTTGHKAEGRGGLAIEDGQLSWFLTLEVPHPGAAGLHPTAPSPCQLSQHLGPSLLWPHGLPSCHRNMLSTRLPQDLCTCSSCCLEHFLREAPPRCYSRPHSMSLIPPPPDSSSVCRFPCSSSVRLTGL